MRHALLRRCPGIWAAALAAAGCGDGEDIGSPNLSDVASVTVTSPAPDAPVGTTVQLAATARDAEGETLAGPTITFAWSVDDARVAAVDQQGRLRALAAGAVTVRVEASAAGQDEPAVGTLEVVVPEIRLVVEPLTVTARIGETFTVSASATRLNGTPVPGVTIAWVSANDAVAQVVATEANPATVRAVGAGTALVNALAGSNATPTSAGVLVEVLGGSTTATGRVVDASNAAPIANAIVDAPSGSLATDPAGTFAVPVGPNDTTVEFSVRATGYETVAVLRRIQPGNTNIGDVPLVASTAVPGAISGVVRNARTGTGVAGAAVTLARGVDDRLRSDPSLPGATSDAQGFYRLTGVPAGTYTVVARHFDYQSNGATGIVVGNDVEVTQADVVLSPLGTNDIRIVLTWGETPSDLDAHATGPGFHVYFADAGNSTAAPFVGLDVDDTDGRGPETITITQLNGTYRFSVHDFTNRLATGSPALARSGAQVKVYTAQGLVRTFNVPNALGNLWAVFTVSGDILTPVFTPLNAMSDVSDPGAVPTGRPSAGGPANWARLKPRFGGAR
jgi:hypothetical protein